jgi:hypothetical protein
VSAVTIRNWTFLIVSALGALSDRQRIAGLVQQRSGTDGDRRRLVLLSLFAAVGWVLTSKRLMNRYDPSSAARGRRDEWHCLARNLGADDRWPSALCTSASWRGCNGRAGAARDNRCRDVWNWGVSRVPMSEAGVFVNLEPVVGSVLGMALLGDRLGWTGIAGGSDRWCGRCRHGVGTLYVSSVRRERAAEGGEIGASFFFASFFMRSA